MSRESHTAPIEDLLAHAGWLRGLAARLVRDHDADDLVQDTWAAALRSPPLTDRATEPWLAAVVRNFARRRWRERRIHNRARPVLATDEIAVPSAHDLLERARLQRVLAESVGALEEPYRSTILLRYYEGKTSGEIARLQGVADGTVRWRLSEGIGRLRRRLDERSGGNRRAWLAVLASPAAPIAGGGRGRPEVVATKGGLLMALGAKSKVGIGIASAVLALMLIGIGARSWRTGDERATRASRQDGRPRRVGALADPALRAEPEVGIAGTVIDPEGRGIAGATVAALCQQARDQPGKLLPMPPRTVRSGPGGIFRIEDLAPGRYTVAASASGFAGAFRGRLDLPAGTTIEGVALQLARGGVIVSGRVEDAGGGIVSGARVRARWSPRPERGDVAEFHLFEVATNSDGRYRLQVPQGHYSLSAQSDGYATVEVPADLDRDGTRDFRLQPAARLSGRVVTGTDKTPVAGAEVRIDDIDQPSTFVRDPAPTDDDGRFRVPALPAGRYMLTAGKGPLAGTLDQPVALSAAGTVGDLEIVVGPGLTIDGTVRSTSGTPIQRARIRLFGQGNRTGSHVFSDQRGRYQYRGLVTGEYRLEVLANGYQTKQETVYLTKATTRDLALEEGVAVRGVVLTSTGQPAGGAELEARHGLRDDTRGMRMTADAQGRFTVDWFGAGELILNAARGDEDGRIGPLLLKRGVHTDVTIRLARGGRVSGVVRWDDGTPAAGARIVGFVRGGVGPHTEETAGQDGRFTIGPVTGDDIVIAAGGPNDRDKFSGVEYSGDRVRLELGPGQHLTGVELTIPRNVSTINGVVVDAATHEPIAGASVSAGPERGSEKLATKGWQVERTVSGPDGTFGIEDLWKGRHTVWSYHPGYADAESRGVETGTTRLVLELRRGGSLAGAVVSPDGTPVALYTMVVVPPGAPGETDAARYLRATAPNMPVHKVADPKGAFQIDGLAPGAHDLIAMAPDGKTAKLAEIQLAEAENRKNLRLVAQAGIAVRGRALDADDGQPIPQARVHIAFEGIPAVTFTDTDGAFDLHDVPSLPGLRVFLSSDAYRFETRAVPQSTDGRADLGAVRLRKMVVVPNRSP